MQKSGPASPALKFKLRFVQAGRRGNELKKWSERQDLNPSPTTDSQAVTADDTQRASQTPVAPLHGLSQVVIAWAKLPELLKAAILVIVKSAE